MNEITWGMCGAGFTILCLIVLGIMESWGSRK